MCFCNFYTVLWRIWYLDFREQTVGVYSPSVLSITSHKIIFFYFCYFCFRGFWRFLERTSRLRPKRPMMVKKCTVPMQHSTECKFFLDFTWNQFWFEWNPAHLLKPGLPNRLTKSSRSGNFFGECDFIVFPHYATWS